MVNLDAKVTVPPPAPSFSTMGKTNDAASKTDINAVHKVRRGVKIASWEGMEMIESILQEVSQKAGGEGSREKVLLSSPRVSPVIVERDASQTANGLVKSFIGHTAMKMNLAHLPAARAVTPSLVAAGGSAGEEGHSSVVSPSRKKGKGRTQKARATAAFLAPARPLPGAELLGRAPSVGKYTPKYNVIERHPEGAKIAVAGTSHGHSPRHHHHHERRTPSPERDQMNATGTSSTFALTQQEADLSRTRGVRGRNTPLDTTVQILSKGLKGTVGTEADAKQRALTPGPVLQEDQEYRAHKVRDVSSVFKAVGRKPDVSLTADLDYWPFPQPGITTYAQGRITPGTRITTADVRTGCGPNTMYYVEDRYRPRSVLQFSRAVSRDAQRTIADTNVKPASLDYKPNPDALSTKPRKGKGYTEFSKQKARAPLLANSASSGEPLGLYHNAVATTKKSGYVEFGKMKKDVRGSSGFSVYPDEKSKELELEVDSSVLQRRTGAVIFSKAEKKSVLGENRSETPEYFPSFSQVQRNRPAASMRGTSREAPVLHEGMPTRRTNESEIDPIAYDRARHISSPDMTHQISRVSRNKVLDPVPHASDVVYDVPAPNPKSITFSKLARK